MIRLAIDRMLAKFGRDHDYDTGYMREVNRIWPGAGLRYLGLTMFSQIRGPAPEITAGALLASTLDGDCGPCAQLVASIAVKSGVPTRHIAACLAREFEAAGDAGLGFRFAEAAIADLTEADDLREEIRSRHGDRAVIAAAYAAAAGRVYPVMKRGLGHGRECRQITLEGVSHPVIRSAA